MNLKKGSNQLTKLTLDAQSTKLTREIIRSAFDSIQLPNEPHKRPRKTVGREALFVAI